MPKNNNHDGEEKKLEDQVADSAGEGSESGTENGRRDHEETQSQSQGQNQDQSQGQDKGQDQKTKGSGEKKKSKNSKKASKSGKKGKGDSEPPQQGAGIVMESRNWYRDRFRQVVIICMVTTAMLMASLAVNLIQGFSEPKPVYFATTEDLRLKELEPLNEPAISESTLREWTTRTVTKTFSIDFVHWQDQLMEVRSDYTEDCFKQLIKSLKDAGNLEMVKDRKLVMSAVAQKAPAITAKGVVDGYMVWKMEFPVTFNYESSERTVASQDLVASVTVRRVPVEDHPRGIQMAQIVLK